MSSVQCELCPKACRLSPGERGDCRIRANIDGRLLALSYARPVAIHVDPIEKKPLYHFRPGTEILSLATVGCNLHCLNCQNWEISQADPLAIEAYELEPTELVELAQEQKCTSVAYTYTEPLVAYEYTLACSERCREAGLANVLVSAGYLNREPLRRLFAVTDAANIDLKSMDDDFYRRVCDARLQPVLDALVLAKQCGVWLEVTYLVVPTLNDGDQDFRSLGRWMLASLGADTPLHLSAFTPQHKLRQLPRTPPERLESAAADLRAIGLRYVYVGNVMLAEGGNTRCPHDGTLLVERRGFQVLRSSLLDGRCPQCGRAIAGQW